MSLSDLSSDVLSGMVLASLFFWGAWGIFDKKSLAYTVPFGQLTAVYCFAPLLALLLTVLLSCTTDSWQLSSHTLFYELLASLSNFMGMLAYLLAMSRAEASLVLGVTASYPLIVQFLAHYLLGEALVMDRLFGCGIIMLGILTMSCSFAKTESRSMSGSGRENFIVLAAVLIAALGWACHGIFDKIAVEAAPALEVNLGKYVCDSLFAGLALFIVYLKRSEIRFFNNAPLWQLSAGSAACLAAGNAAYYVALSKLSVSYVIAITGCYPVVMYILALLILKERFNLRRAFGIALITLGGILTQSTQNC